MHVLTERPILCAGATHAARGPGEMKGEVGRLHQVTWRDKARRPLGVGGVAIGHETLGGNGEHKYFSSHFHLIFVKFIVT